MKPIIPQFDKLDFDFISPFTPGNKLATSVVRKLDKAGVGQTVLAGAMLIFAF